MPGSSIRSHTPPPVVAPSSHTNTPSQQNDEAQTPTSSHSSGIPGCGTVCKWWFGKLAALLPRNAAVPAALSSSPSTAHLLAAHDDVPSYSREESSAFFAGHFRSDAFRLDEESGKIDITKYRAKKDEFANALERHVKGSKYTHVRFHDLPECTADYLSPSMVIRELGTKPGHVSLVLIRLTFKKLMDVLRSEAGLQRLVRLDFSRYSVVSEPDSSPAGSAAHASDGYLALPFKDVMDAMAHFGTLLPENAPDPGIWNIPGLSVGADLSGLKIDDPRDLGHLHSMVIRSTIESIHIDLSRIQHHFATWENLAKMLDAHDAKTLRDLTVRVSGMDEQASSQAASILAAALCPPASDTTTTYPLQSLTLNDGDWSDEARALLSDAVKRRQTLGQPLTVTINGQQL